MDFGADATPPGSNLALPVFKAHGHLLRRLLTLLIQLIAPDLSAPVSALQGRQLSSADVRLLHRGRKQPGESKQGKGFEKHSSAVFLW